MYVCVCVCECVCVCMCVCARMCVCVCMCAVAKIYLKPKYKICMNLLYDIFCIYQLRISFRKFIPIDYVKPIILFAFFDFHWVRKKTMEFALATLQFPFLSV